MVLSGHCQIRAHHFYCGAAGHLKLKQTSSLSSPPLSPHRCCSHGGGGRWVTAEMKWFVDVESWCITPKIFPPQRRWVTRIGCLWFHPALMLVPYFNKTKPVFQLLVRPSVRLSGFYSLFRTSRMSPRNLIGTVSVLKPRSPPSVIIHLLAEFSHELSI